MTPSIRWMIRRDLPEVLSIAAASSLPVSDNWVIERLRRKDCIGRVAEHSERIVGFSIYQYMARKMELLHFAVHPAHRGEGIGVKLLDDLTSKLSINGKRKVLDCMIRETDLELLQFFRHHGFRGQLWRNHFGSEDAIRMRLDVRELATV